MQLRTHPKTKWEGFFNWPPAWGGSYGRGDIFPVGEEGVLIDEHFRAVIGEVQLFSLDARMHSH